MFRTILMRGASVGAMTLAVISSAQAQQTLPTIHLGNKNIQHAGGKPSTNTNAGRTSGTPTTVAANSVQGAGVGNPGLPDRYAEPKPAPFSRTLPANIPAVVESRTRAQIDNTVNYLSSAQVFKYMPSLYVRERYIGDQNGVVTGRTNGSNESANTMVYADNILLSNYIGNGFTYAPRWGMVAPEEIERVDVIYGPFSALYQGNSVSGVLAITTRMPEKFEIHARGIGSAQTYNNYQYSSTPLAGNMNVLVGDKKNDLRYFVNWNHLDATSQPQNFPGNVLTPTTGTAGPRFYGGSFDFDPRGYPRINTGASAITHTVQDQIKLKTSYDVAPLTRVYYQAGFWNNVQDESSMTFIKDVNGMPIYNTQSSRIQVPGSTGTGGFSVQPGGNNPSHGHSQQLMQAIQLKRDSGGEFDYDASVTSYNYLRDYANQAYAYGLLPSNNPSTGANRYLINPTGVNTVLTGTYWRTGDIRAIYRPNMDLQGKHEFSFGTHSDIYSLNQSVQQTVQWPDNYAMGYSNFNKGKTTMQGLYGQDAWSINDQLKFIGGLRNDWWNAENGSNASGAPWNVGSNCSGSSGVGGLCRVGLTTTATKYGAFPTSSKSGFQPKAALEYKVTKEYEVRASMGRAYRMPTVAELFQNINTPTTQFQNNPNLQPQVSTSYDFTQSARVVDAFGGAIGLLNPRVSLFLEERWNAIYAQTTRDFAGQNSTQNVNINRARFRGVEAALVTKDFFIKGLDYSGSITFTDARILNNNTDGTWPLPLWQNAGAIGATWSGAMTNGNLYPRIPPIKIRSALTYAPNKEMDFAFGARYDAASFNTIGNIDFNHDTWGAVSSALIFDCKANYKFEKNWVATFGIDNIGNFKAYQFHALPQRTFFGGIRYDFGGPDSQGTAADSLVAGNQQQTGAFQ